MEEMRFLPPIKVGEEGDEVVVRVNVEGIDEDDIQFGIDDDSLEIGVSKGSGKKVEGDNYLMRQWSSGSYDWAVSLPSKVVPMPVNHSYDGSVLEVRLKKA
jgi:HSP20 family protein